ncbi:hypothetical protein [Ammonifex thiophilus]|nr:hypothetical protein [Ammonifex thiophilus]
MRWKHKGKSQTGLILATLVLLLNAMGVGLAAWQEGLVMKGTVATGEIDPVFTRCEVAGESCAPSRARTWIVDGGKRLILEVQDAYPGYYVRFRYRVANLGTVPVRFVAEAHSANPAILIDLTQPTGIIDGRGNYLEGDLSLTVGAAEECKDYCFSVCLSFQQWNAGKLLQLHLPKGVGVATGE